MPHLLEYYETRGFDKFKNVNKKINTNEKLHKILDIIKNSIKKNMNVNKEIWTIYELMAYKSYLDLKKYYDKKLYVPTLFFRAYSSNPTKKHYKLTNKFALLEKIDLEKNNGANMFKYDVILDANHYMWINQYDSDMIINEINHMLSDLGIN